MQDHTQLRVWQRAHELHVYVHRATQQVRVRDTGSFRSQLRRATASIPANIAEGAGQETSAQFARFLTIAIASDNEALSHVASARDLNFLNSRDCARIHEELQAVRAMLILLLRRVQERDRAFD